MGEGAEEKSGQPVVAMCALAVMATVNEVVIPEFERAGSNAKIIWDPTVALMNRIKAGQHADAILAIDWALDELAAKGRIIAESRRPIAQVFVGVGVRSGAAKPDISTAASLRRTLLEVPSLVYSEAGASGIIFEKLLDRLDIRAAIETKATIIPAGFTGELVASGDVALAIQQVSELMVVDGVDLVGPMPPELDATTDFSAAVFTDATDPAAAEEFVKLLVTPEARQSYEQTGMAPLFS